MDQSVHTAKNGATVLMTDPGITSGLLEGVPMKEYRCPTCNILVLKACLPPGSCVQIPCPRDECDRQRRHLGEGRFLVFWER